MHLFFYFFFLLKSILYLWEPWSIFNSQWLVRFFRTLMPGHCLVFVLRSLGISCNMACSWTLLRLFLFQPGLLLFVCSMPLSELRALNKGLTEWIDFISIRYARHSHDSVKLVTRISKFNLLQMLRNTLGWLWLIGNPREHRQKTCRRIKVRVLQMS